MHATSLHITLYMQQPHTALLPERCTAAAHLHVLAVVPVQHAVQQIKQQKGVTDRCSLFPAWITLEAGAVHLTDMRTATTSP
jgi:hypothetical protein